MIGTPQNALQAAASAPQQQQVTETQRPSHSATPASSSFGGNNSSFGSGAGLPNQNIIPISAIHPYRNSWVIKARVTNKGRIRTWNNQRGEGKLFSFTMLDSSGVDIRGTMFNETCDKYYPLIEQDKVYLFTRGKVKPGDPKWNTCKSDYEITFSNDSNITPVEDDASILQETFNFKSLAKIEEAMGTTTDVCGVITNVGDLSSIISKKSGKEMTKKNITLSDQSGVSVEMTLWNDDTNLIQSNHVGHILAVKEARVSDFNGVSLSTSFSGKVVLDPINNQHANQLKGWYEKEGQNQSFHTLTQSRGGGSGRPSRRITIRQIQEEGLGYDEKPSFFDLNGTVIYFHKNDERLPWYLSCTHGDCKKKVLQEEVYRCPSCDLVVDDPEPRYLLSFLCADATGSQWLSCFNDEAAQVLGMTAREARDLKNVDEARYNDMFVNASYKEYTFKCKAKNETYNDSSKVKVTAFRVEPTKDFVADSTYLLEQIALYA